MPPNHLAVYLSNRCNLACSYCYVSVNEGEPARLSFEDVRRSVDYFYSQVPPPDRKITFLGGEPLLNWPLFERAARYAREAGGPAVVLQTFTNGTLLTRERLEVLNELDVLTTVSLDGRKEDNDRARVYFKDADRSVFEDVMKRLEGLSLDRLGVSLVFTAETVGRLLSNIDFFYRLGFSRITFNPELYEPWPEDKLRALAKSLEGLRRYYRALLDAGQRPFVIQILFAILENGPKNREGVRWWHDCHNVVLGPDRKFYACDKPLTFPIGTARETVVGDAESGMDWGARQAHYREAIAYVEGRGYGKSEHFCPMGVYFYSRHEGSDPGPLMDNFHRVADVFAGGLSALVADLRDHPVFQDLYVHTRVV